MPNAARMLCHLQPQFLAVVLASVMSAHDASGQEYYYDSFQITDRHRFDGEGTEMMGGSWGHHLGHMVRTATQGLWYVDDGGRDVWLDSTINYYHFSGDSWSLTKTLIPAEWIQQNFATVAVGDSIFSYATNLLSGSIDEAFYDTRTHTAGIHRNIINAGSGSNYVGAAISPAGARVVWWTIARNPVGPSIWYYAYNADGRWSSKIGSSIAGADFSYVFASFLNDSTFYVGGEVPKGWGPYTYEVAAGKVVLGHPLEEFVKMTGTAADGIWVNRANGDVHLVCYGPFGNFGYYYKAAGERWTNTVALSEDLGSVGKSRLIDSPDGNLYLIISGNGFRMMPIPKSSISGMIDFSRYELIPLGRPDGYNNSCAIWAEAPEFQTAPLGGINFASPGNDWDFSNLLRHTRAMPNPGNVLLRVSFPNGAEFLKGSKHTISWYAFRRSGIDTIAIESSTDGGANWALVDPKVPNTGFYLWTVPAIQSSTCRIRIFDARDGIHSDTSDADFSISNAPVVHEAPVAAITRPAKDTVIAAGSTMTFEGIGTDADGYIVNYVWQSGDGGSSKGVAKKFVHPYTVPGIYNATLRVQDNDTLWSVPDSIRITVQASNSVEQGERLSCGLQVLSGYPNPFNDGTVFGYFLEQSTHVLLRVFSVTGTEIARLVDDQQGAGMYQVRWDARTTEGVPVASGLYLCKLESTGRTLVAKALLLR